MKKLLIQGTDEGSVLSEAAMAGLRVFAGLAMAFGHGLNKLPPSAGLIDGVASMGFPAPELFAWAAALAEFVGGLLLAAGLLTRPAALSVALTMAVAAFGAHAADPFQKKELALLYLFVSLIFVVRGAGKWSIDRRLA